MYTPFTVHFYTCIVTLIIIVCLSHKMKSYPRYLISRSFFYNLSLLRNILAKDSSGMENESSKSNFYEEKCVIRDFLSCVKTTIKP